MLYKIREPKQIMKDLIRQIRQYCCLSQSEFARSLNVTFATVNRWENGHSEPNALAQDRIGEFCRANGVPVYDMILSKIDGVCKTLRAEGVQNILFHGSKTGIIGEICPKSRKQCDFGRGFYMGSDPAQALALTCDYENSKLYILSLDTTDLVTNRIEPGMDWAMTVALNRGKMENYKDTSLYKRYKCMTEGYDVVIGSIADDRLFFVLDNFVQLYITDKALVSSLKALDLGIQYVAKTQKACSAIKVHKEIPISDLERSFIRDVASEYREKGIALADQVCKEHRRDGLYLDEILSNKEARK